MSKVRIVLDTNVVVSAAIQPHGLPAQLVGLISSGAVEMCVSEDVVAEFCEVFGRPKFAGLDQRGPTHGGVGSIGHG